MGGGEKHLWLLPQFRVIAAKRRCEFWRNKSRGIFILYWLSYRKLSTKYSVDIPASVKIGHGFKIEHVGGIVINPDVVIGKNCNIYNGVTIGKEKRGKRMGTPIIGDCVWMGPNAIIVGNIKIGNDVLIAPGAYVNFDVPEHSIVLGNPGRIIYRNNATAEYIKYTI